MKWLLATRRRRLLLISAGILAVPALALAWWLGSPLFINRTVEEEFVFGGRTYRPASMGKLEVEAVMADAASIELEAAEPMTGEMTAATAVKAGQFHDADSFHKGAGKATIYRLPDGGHVLRLEDFRVTNGPDLHVILSRAGDPDSRAAVMGDGYVDLGSLKGNIGNQNYALPSDVDPAVMGSVVIYCKPFHVVFSVAPLTRAN